MDYMLRTDTQEQMDQALASAGLVSDTFVDGVYIDHIGPISKPPVLDAEGAEVSPGSTDSRWHTNIRVMFELTEEQIAALPVVDPPPAIPYRVFA